MSIYGQPSAFIRLVIIIVAHRTRIVARASIVSGKFSEGESTFSRLAGGQRRRGIMKIKFGACATRGHDFFRENENAL